MQTQRRWTLVPRSTTACVLFLLLGVALVAYNVWQIAEADEAAVLPVIAAALGVVTIGAATAGLVSPRLRDQ